MPSDSRECRCHELAARINNLEQDIRKVAKMAALNSRAGLIIAKVLRDNGMGSGEVTH